MNRTPVNRTDSDRQLILVFVNGSSDEAMLRQAEARQRRATRRGLASQIVTVHLNGVMWSAEPSYPALAAALATLTPRSRLCLLGHSDRASGDLSGWSAENAAMVLCLNGLRAVGAVCVVGGRSGDAFAARFQAVLKTAFGLETTVMARGRRRVLTAPCASVRPR